MPWKIRSKTETDHRKFKKKQESLYWSNEFGWTWKDQSDTFTNEEKESLLLPIGGVWEEV